MGSVNAPTMSDAQKKFCGRMRNTHDEIKRERLLDGREVGLRDCSGGSLHHSYNCIFPGQHRPRIKLDFQGAGSWGSPMSRL